MTDENEGTEQEPPEEKYEVFNPPNHLRSKVGQSRNVDQRHIARAEANLARDQETCEGWADEQMAKLAEIAGDLASEPIDRMTQMDKLYRIAHDMRGLGGMFGYPLVTKICANLGLHMDSLPAHAKIDDIVVRAHVDALRAVFKEQAGGEEHVTGSELVTELQALVREFS